MGEALKMIVTRARQVRAGLVDTGAAPGGLCAVPFKANAFDANNNVHALEWERNQ